MESLSQIDGNMAFIYIIVVIALTTGLCWWVTITSIMIYFGVRPIGPKEWIVTMPSRLCNWLRPMPRWKQIMVTLWIKFVIAYTVMIMILLILNRL